MSYDSYEFMIVDVQSRIATVTLNRPDARNAIHRELHVELEHFFADVARDQGIDVILITGAGKAFSAGGDLKRMVSRLGTDEGLQFCQTTPAATKRLFESILDVGQPIVAAVNGDAIGLGATLALFADIVVMSETAKLGDTHTKVGLVAGDGGAVIWPLLIGPARAKEMLMLSRVLTGADACRMGIVNHAVAAEEVLTKARSFAEELAALPTWAVRWTKVSINKQIKDQLNLVLDASIAYEMMSMLSRDHAEAVTALAEKRSPKFRGL